MNTLPEDKQMRIQALLASLPGDMADRLCATANKGDPALGRLLMLCREGIDNASRERLFEPLAPVSGDPEFDPPSRAYTPAKLIETLWAWLAETAAPDTVRAIKNKVSDFEAEIGQGQLDPFRVEVADQIVSAIRAVDDNPKAEKKLKARLEVRDFEAILHTAEILRCSPVVRTALKGLPAHISDMTDALSATIRDRYEAASDENPDAAVWFLFMLMARMERPWRILRVFEKIARRGDDLLVSQTDMATLGDALLADAEFELKAFERAPVTHEQTQRALDGLARFSAITVGMTREIGIRKDGDWGKHLFELRTKASEQMARIHTATKDKFWMATPEGGGSKRRFHGSPPKLGEPDFIEVEALLAFMVAAKDDAGRAAVGNAHNDLIEKIHERLEMVSQSLLADLRSGKPEQADFAAERCDEIARFLTLMGSKEAADVLLRRVAAARAA